VTPERVTLSRRSAVVLGYLNAEHADGFRETVAIHESIDSVPLPYRLWLLDPREIPMSARARFNNVTTGERLIRPIPENPFV